MHGRADDKKPRAQNFRSALWLFVKLSYFNFLITSSISMHISISCTVPYTYFKLYAIIIIPGNIICIMPVCNNIS